MQIIYTLRSGREIDANHGIIGLSNSGWITDGYDSVIDYCDPENGQNRTDQRSAQPRTWEGEFSPSRLAHGTVPTECGNAVARVKPSHHC